MILNRHWPKRGWLRRARPVLLAFGASVALAGCAISEEDDRARIAQQILETPGAEDLYAAIQEEYPEDFDALVSRFQALDPSQRRDEDRIREIGGNWLQAFLTRITTDAIKAPAEPIIAWSAAESRLYATLQRAAVEQCAQLTMGEWVIIDEGDPIATRAVAARNRALVRAAAAGRDDPQSYAQPDQAAFNRLGDTIAQTGIDPDLQAVLGSIEQMQALSPDQQCELGVALYTGISNLPDADEPAMAAWMLAPE